MRGFPSLGNAPVHHRCITVTTAGAVGPRRRIAVNASGSTSIGGHDQVRVNVEAHRGRVPGAIGELACRHAVEVPERDSSVPEAMRGAVRQVHAPTNVAHRRAKPVGSDVRKEATAKGQRGGDDLHEPTRHGDEPCFPRAAPAFPIDGSYAEAESRGIDIVAFERYDLAHPHRGLLQEHEWEAVLVGESLCQGRTSAADGRTSSRSVLAASFTLRCRAGFGSISAKSITCSTSSRLT
jgi:hypothetical protein